MLLEFLQAITGVFVVVYDGQHALRFTLGRAEDVVGPGLHFKLPIIQRFRIEETKHTTLDLEPQAIQLEDDLVYEVDAKVLYQIVDLRRALIQIDDLVTGLQNRVVMAIQKVVRAQSRATIRDTDAIIAAVRAELTGVEQEWGIRFLQIGFSNISPSPASLEITQLDLLARERLGLYQRFREQGLDSSASAALITGAVVATDGAASSGRRGEAAEFAALRERVDALVETRLRERAKRAIDEPPAPGEAGQPPTGSGGEDAPA